MLRTAIEEGILWDGAQRGINSLLASSGIYLTELGEARLIMIK